jgi:hypothetical protein
MVALTGRASDITRLLVEAKSDKEIAYELNLSPGTIKVYLTRLYGRLGISACMAGSPRVALAMMHARGEVSCESLELSPSVRSKAREAKLSASLVRSIREDARSLRLVARDCDVSSTTIARAKHGRTYRWVK